MAGQSGDDGAEGVSVTGPQARWVDERAEALGLTGEEYLERVLASLRAVEDGDPLDELAGAAEVQSLTQRLNELDQDLDRKIEDVRERVLQVKHEVDQKAPADHSHEDLATTVEEAAATADRTATQVEAMAETVTAVEERLDAGFENYEEILTYLVDRTDDLADHTETMASAIVALRREVAAAATGVERMERADRLKRRANEEGVATASCGACESEVQVALLTDPECPFCGATFTDVEAKKGFFGSARLAVGSAPALEGETGEETDDVGADLAAVIDGESDASGRDSEEWLEKIESVVDVEETDAPVEEDEDG
ncbi:MAG: hypothetical protein ABEJ67_06785 [Halanaeroarchaeum sp.]